MALFFVSCPLHFENCLAEEIQMFWFEMMDLDGQPTREPLPVLAIEAGGIEIKCPEHLGYQINFFSKLALRVLIRIHRFTARFYDQFEREIKLLPLEKWIADKSVSVKIETAKSRLNHERNLLEACTKALLSKGIKLQDSAEQKVYVRIVKDNAVVSLDTSGEHLHKRGYAMYRGEAPLRENLAALMVQQLYKNGFEPATMKLVDPFVGSGTLLFEAASFFVPNFFRKYSWLNFKNKPKIFASENWNKNFRWLQKLSPNDLVGIDNDPEALENLAKNYPLFEASFPTTPANITKVNDDSDHVATSDLGAKKPTWIITNPPYGVRLTAGSPTQVINHIDAVTNLVGAVIVHPETMRFEFERLRLSSQIDFSNQGLKIKLSVYTL